MSGGVGCAGPGRGCPSVGKGPAGSRETALGSGIPPGSLEGGRRLRNGLGQKLLLCSLLFFCLRKTLQNALKTVLSCAGRIGGGGH